MRSMNKNSVLVLLLKYLADILCYGSFTSELLGLIAGSGYEMKFFSLLQARLQILSAYGIRATVAKEFEPISDGIYSMHLSGRDFNIRILYAFLPNGQPVLLSCFEEKEGKKRTDYTNYTPEAVRRFQKMRKDYNDGK